MKSSNTEMNKNLTSQRETSRTRSELVSKVKDPCGLLKSNKSPFARVLASLIFCVALLPGAAQAIPVLFESLTGGVDIVVEVGGVVIGTASGGVSGSLTIDHDAQSLNGLDLQLSSNILISLSQSYGGFDLVNIENATIASDTLFSSTLVSSSAQSFSVIGTPLVVNGAYGAADINPGFLGPVVNVPINFSIPSITAAIDASSIAFTGLTLNSLSGADFRDEADDLTIKAEIIIDGGSAFPPSISTPIPEPSTALLMSLALGLLTASRRRSV